MSIACTDRIEICWLMKKYPPKLYIEEMAAKSRWNALDFLYEFLEFSDKEVNSPGKLKKCWYWLIILFAVMEAWNWLEILDSNNIIQGEVWGRWKDNRQRNIVLAQEF